MKVASIEDLVAYLAGLKPLDALYKEVKVKVALQHAQRKT